MGGKNESKRVASPESVPMHLKIFERMVFLHKGMMNEILTATTCINFVELEKGLVLLLQNYFTNQELCHSI